MANEMDTSTESESSTHSRSHRPPPPRLEEVKKNYGKAHNSTEISQFVVIIDKIIEQLDSYDFIFHCKK
ncbi:hypothetical protein TNCV_236931 [Trichonephila clavipes]|nr:hypothetical protein TNCV_236931 [Trichonephila clavipes]